VAKVFRRSRVETPWKYKNLNVLSYNDRRLRKRLAAGWEIDAEAPLLLKGTSAGTSLRLRRRNPAYREPVPTIG
jgi:hypothetical protein